MRMSRQLEASARDVLRTASLEELARIFRVYGEERRARAIARRIVDQRDRDTDSKPRPQLARLVERVLGPQRGSIHPATRVFQALRIQVNHELENLKRGSGGGRGSSGVGSAPGRHLLSFAGRSDRETVFRANEHGMRLPAATGRVRVRAEGGFAGRHAQADHGVGVRGARQSAQRAARSCAWRRRFEIRDLRPQLGVGNPRGAAQGGRSLEDVEA